MMYGILLPIWRLNDIFSTTSSIHWDDLFYPYFWKQILTIWKLELSPDHKNFYLQGVPVIILEQPLQHVSWTAQISVPLLARVSTTLLSLVCMVPIFRDAICSFNLFCRISHDFDLMGTIPTPVLLLTTPSHKVPVPLFLSTTFTYLLTGRFLSVFHS